MLHPLLHKGSRTHSEPSTIVQDCQEWFGIGRDCSFFERPIHSCTVRIVADRIDEDLFRNVLLVWDLFCAFRRLWSMVRGFLSGCRMT